MLVFYHLSSDHIHIRVLEWSSQKTKYDNFLNNITFHGAIVKSSFMDKFC